MDRNNNHEPSLWELSMIIWNQRKLMLIFLLVLLPISLLYLHTATPLYSVSLKVYPVEEKNDAVSSGLNNLSMLTGVTLGAEGNNFSLYLAGVHNFETAQTLSEDEDIMKYIFENEWDKKRNQWVEPDNFIKKVKDLLKKIIGIQSITWEKPGSLRMHEFLENNIVINKNADNSIETLSLQTKNPELGIKILQSIHSISDSTLRQRALINTNDNIEYIENKLKDVKIIEYRQALIDILSSQEKQRMMAMSGKHYSGQPFDLPIRSINPVSPSPVLVLIMTTIIAVFFGALLGIITDHLQTRTQT